MLDGRVLGASQVEYKPFGKPPLQREKSVFGKCSAVLGLASQAELTKSKRARLPRSALKLWAQVNFLHSDNFCVRVIAGPAPDGGGYTAGRFLRR